MTIMLLNISGVILVKVKVPVVATVVQGFEGQVNVGV
jgi:hypothetical protein